jgi:uncharacterized protein
MHQIQHDRHAHRFSIHSEGRQSELDYQLEGGTMTLLHTGVPEVLSGRGIGSALVAAAFETARKEGWKVRPSCSFAAAWAERHPDVADLLA